LHQQLLEHDQTIKIQSFKLSLK